MKNRQGIRIWSFWVALFCALLLLAPSPGVAARSASSIMTRILRHADEAAELGRQSGQVLNAADKANMLKRFPHLATKGDDVILGAKMVEDFAAAGSKQARLMDALDNPVSLMRMEKNMQKTWSRVDDIATVMASAKGGLGDLRRLPALSNLPQQTLNNISNILGNYKATANATMNMLRRGGKKSMEVLETLKKYLPDPNMRNLALGLMAWHMIDPDGAEEAISNFFRDHAIPLMTAPVKGTVEGLTKGVTDLDNAAVPLMDAIKNLHSEILIFIAIVICVCFKPCRRTILALLALPFNCLTRKIHEIDSGSGLSRSEKKKGASPSFDASKFNADLHRGSKCKIRK